MCAGTARRRELECAGAPNNRNSMNGVQIIYDSYTEFTAAHLPTVPVMRQNKRIGIPQGDR